MKLSALWLAPLAFLYGIATRFRNYLFNIGYSRSFNYQIMVIAVGNLSVGGTGKSPMTEYLIRLLHKAYALSTLSRGYKRKSKGFLFADKYTTVAEIGDEPYQMYLKYGKVAKIAVGEERAIAIPNILLEHPETQIVIMDDGYQHRSVNPDLSILLSDYSYPFYEDHLLPWGRLREAKIGAKRAQAVLITKCPELINDDEMTRIKGRVRHHAGQDMPVFFSKIIYSRPRSLTDNSSPEANRFVAFAGLANNERFNSYVNSNYEVLETIDYPDHHAYSEADIEELVEKAEEAKASLITTEKDIVKFRDKKLAKLFGRMKLYYLSIEHQFINSGNVFDDLVRDAIAEKYKVEE